RAALRRPDPGGTRQVAPEPARHLVARRAAEHDRRSAGELRGDGCAPSLAVDEAADNVAIRLAIGPSPRRIDVGGELAPGRGAVLREGTDAILFAYGPVMLHEALAAAETLGDRIQVIDMPWLNRVDAAWLAEPV